MANAYKCDVCGELYEYFDGLSLCGRSKGFNSIELMHKGYYGRPEDNAYLKRMDLCPTCCTKLNDFLFGSSGRDEISDERKEM